MSKPKRHYGDLDIEINPSHQRREWRIERIVRLLFILILLAALLGATGSGLLSDARTSDPTGLLTVDYKRIARWEAPHTIYVRAQRRDEMQNAVRIWIDRKYLEKMEVSQLTPQPERTIWLDDRLVLEFPLAPGATGGGFHVDLRGRGFGMHHFEIGLDESPGVKVRQFILP